MGPWGITIVSAVVSLISLAASFLVWRKSANLQQQLRASRSAPYPVVDEISSLLNFEAIRPASESRRGGRKAPKPGTFNSDRPSDAVLAKVARLRNALQHLPSSTGTSGEQLAAGTELRTLQDQLESGLNAQQLRAADQRLRDLARKTLTIALSSSDRDIDRERANLNIQRALNELCGVACCQFIDPKKNDRFDKAEHSLLGSVRSPDPALRDKIASVATRGLRTEEGGAIALSEVYVYD